MCLPEALPPFSPLVSGNSAPQNRMGGHLCSLVCFHGSLLLLSAFSPPPCWLDGAAEDSVLLRLWMAETQLVLSSDLFEGVLQAPCCSCGASLLCPRRCCSERKYGVSRGPKWQLWGQLQRLAGPRVCPTAASSHSFAYPVSDGFKNRPKVTALTPVNE